MDKETGSPLRRTWGWATGWKDSLSFWLTDVGTGILLAAVVLVATGDPGLAGLAFVTGAIVAFSLLFVGRWLTTPWRDFRDAATDLQETATTLAARAQSLTAASSAGAQISLTDAARARFNAYVDKQIERLRLKPDLIVSTDTQWFDDEWDDFVTLAWRTTGGIRQFDDQVADYVEATIKTVQFELSQKVYDREDMLRWAERIIDAVDDTKMMYD